MPSFVEKMPVKIAELIKRPGLCKSAGRKTQFQGTLPNEFLHFIFRFLLILSSLMAHGSWLFKTMIPGSLP